MFLPACAAFARTVVAIPARTLEFWTVLATIRVAVAIPPEAIEFRPFAERTIALRTIALRTILARPRKPRTLAAASILTRLVEARLVVTALFEWSSTVAGRTRVTPDMIG